jgi:hypothetical protein
MLPCIAWCGPPGCGKKTRVYQQLEGLAKRFGIAWGPHQILHKQWKLKPDKPGGGGGRGGDDNDSDDGGADEEAIPYESSPLHMGFDIYRMSMKDKIYIDSIISRITPGQNLYLTGQADIPKILVLYHAHIMNDESLLLLHYALETYGDKFVLWVTTEEPIPMKVTDYFHIIPMGGADRRAVVFKEKYELAHGDIWIDWFRWRVRDALVTPLTLDTIKMVRTWVYTCLQRNLRWSQMIYYWFQAVAELKLTSDQHKLLLTDMLQHENTQAFSSLLSYRIPILWESFFLGQVKLMAGMKNIDEEHKATSI